VFEEIEKEKETSVCDQTLAARVRSMLGLWPRGPSHDWTLRTVVTGPGVVRPVIMHREGVDQLHDQTLRVAKDRTLRKHYSQSLVMLTQRTRGSFVWTGPWPASGHKRALGELTGNNRTLSGAESSRCSGGSGPNSTFRAIKI
jgi:hypothetical protein